MSNLEIAALLGTQKTLPTITWPNPQLAAIATQLPPQNLLAQLALMTVYQRAGQKPISLMAQQAALVEVKLPANTKQKKPLIYLLSSDGQDYLSTWLQLAAQAHIVVPYAVLPQLLTLGTQNKKWRLAIGTVAGTRGTWLAEQNSDWAWLTGAQIALDHPKLDDYWQTANAAARELLFERLRQHQPTQALVFLQHVWHEESAATRKTLLEKLLTHLTMADHDFLEQCLDDRSKVVKEVAIDLLARLPQSALQQRMQIRLAQHLNLKKGLIHKSLLVNAVETIDDTLERDGLNPKAAEIKQSLGEKAQWLRDMVAVVSLDWLSDYYQMSPEAFVTAALKTDWAEAILSGLSTAAIRQQQQTWLTALLDVDSKKCQLPRFALFNTLSDSAKESYLLADIAKISKLNERASHLISWLYQTQTWLWSAKLTIVIMDVYQQLLASNQNSQLHYYLARCGDIKLVQQANQYPQQIVNAWLMRMEIVQAFT